MKVLSLNAGSSTLKFALFDFKKGEVESCSVLMRGLVDKLGQANTTLRITPSSGVETTTSVGNLKMPEAVRTVLDKVGEIDAVGCRIVHGGTRFTETKLVTQEVVDAIRELAPLAPLHNARDVEVIEAVQKLRPEHPVVAVFDTTFHRTLPPVASHYAIPKALAEKEHVRRFGFHGISYRFVLDQIKKVRATKSGRLVLCHLGSGASVCAVLDGKSIDTSMGMTPLEGLVMGTRSGDIDPGAVLYLLREKGMSVADVDALLNHKSGLLGLSGRSPDVRDLEIVAAGGDQAAEFALDSFSYRVAKYVGAYSVVLGGLDALVFSGGIGENSDEMRRRICRRLGSLSITTSLAKPDEGVVSCLSGSGAPSVWVVRTDEERQIAYETLNVASSSPR